MSETIRATVQASRDIQRKWFGVRSLLTLAFVICNEEMREVEIRELCGLQDSGQNLIWMAMIQLNLSARTYQRILKLARTTADLAGREESQPHRLAELLQYGPKLMLS